MTELKSVYIKPPLKSGIVYKIPFEKLESFIKGINYKGSCPVYRSLLDTMEKEPFMYLIK